MADVVNVGITDNDGNGDTLRAAFSQINTRFNELLGTIDGGDAWAPTTAYTATPVRQWVINAGQAYVAAENHTSGATFAADLAAGKWFAVDSAQILADLAAPTGASLIGYTPTGLLTATTVEGALNEVRDASKVAYTPAGAGAVPTNVQSKLLNIDEQLLNIDGNLNFSTLALAKSPVDDADLMILRQGTTNKKLPASTFRTEFATTAIAASISATNAKVAAESARDAALIQAGVYTTEPLGRAAVADGVAFKVQGSGDIAAYEYRRVSAGVVSTLIATYPTAASAIRKATAVATRDLVVTTAGVPNFFAIQSDAVYGNLPTLNLFDGTALRYIETLPFSPSDLYSSSSKGAWLDVSLPQTVFTDLTGTTPVTSNGDLVRMVKLRYGNTQQALGNILIPRQDQTAWTAAGTTVVADAGTGPDGTATADQLIVSAASGVHGRTFNTTKVVGINYRNVLVVKPGACTKVRFGTSAGVVADYNLTTGAVITTVGSPTNVSIVASTGGYYVCSFDSVAASTSEQASVYLLNAGGSVSYTGNGTDDIFVASADVYSVAGMDLFQSTDAKRPSFVVDGSKMALRFSSAGSQFLIKQNFDLAGTSKATMVLAFKNNGTATAALFEHGAAFTSGGLGAYLNNGTTGCVGGAIGTTSNYLANNGQSGLTPATTVLTLVYDPAAATNADKCRVRVNGQDVTENTAVVAGSVSTTAFAARDAFIGGRAGTGLFSDADLYCWMLIDRELTAAEISRAEEWAQLRASGNYFILPSSFTDSGTPIANSTRTETSAFARTVFNTYADSITVASWNNIYGSYPALTSLGVVVNGVYNQTISPGASGGVSQTISLPFGAKTVEIVNGAQSYGGGVLGTFVKSVSATVPLTQVFPATPGRVLVYGDSIAIGQDSTPTPKNAWAMLVRKAAQDAGTKSVAMEAWGTRALFDDTNTAPLLAAFVAKLVVYAPTTIWLAIGTNDYGLNKWSAASFGTAYAALLDAIRTALPSVVIYCQTPLLRTSEGANGSGSTLGNYRTQIATAVSTRTAYATLVDGTTFMTTASLSDGLHPSTAGHALYANAVKTVLGL